MHSTANAIACASENAPLTPKNSTPACKYPRRDMFPAVSALFQTSETYAKRPEGALSFVAAIRATASVMSGRSTNSEPSPSVILNI